MTRIKPKCPSCNDDKPVRTIGGGSTNKYIYECDICNTIWQQTPPHRINDILNKDEDLSICKSNTRRSQSYKCGRCGLPKKGHVCLVANPEKAQLEAAKILASNAFVPPTPALLEQPVLLKGEEIIVPNLPKMPFSGFVEW